MPKINVQVLLMLAVSVLVSTCQVALATQPTAERLNSPRWWFARAVEAADAMSDQDKRVELWRWIGQGQGEARDLVGFASTIDRIKAFADSTEGKKKAKLYVELLQLQAQAGLFDAARQTADSLVDPRDRWSAYSKIVEEQANQGDIEGAKRTAGLIGDEHRSALAFWPIARTQADSDLDAALDTMLNVAPKVRAWALRQLAGRARRAGKSAAFERAVRLALDDATELESFYESLAYAQIAEQLRATGDLDVDLTLVERTKEALREIATHTHDHNVRTHAAEGLIALGEFEDAGEMIGAIQGNASRVLKDRLARALAAHGRLQEAKATSKAALPAIVRAHAESGRWREATTTAFEIVDGRERAQAIKTIAIAQLRAGEAKTARKTAEQISDPGTKAYCFLSIAHMEAEAGDHGAARESLRAASEAIPQIKDTNSQSFAGQAVAVAQAKFADTDGAVSTASLVQQVRERATAFVHIAAEQHKAGDMVGFDASLQRAREAAHTISCSEGSQAAAYARIATLYAQAGRRDAFRDVITKALANARQLEGPFWKCAAYAGIVGAYAAAQVIGELPKVIDRMDAPLERATASLAAGLFLLRSND